MNHCLLEIQVKTAPTVRYTQNNQTPVAEMEVLFDGLRADDSPGEIKVIGWGNMAQEMQNKVQVGQKLVLEGRLRMNTVPRQDGTKEKKAELTLSKFHPFSKELKNENPNKALGEKNLSNTTSELPNTESSTNKSTNSQDNNPSWDSSPLIPDTDEIPF